MKQYFTRLDRFKVSDSFNTVHKGLYTDLCNFIERYVMNGLPENVTCDLSCNGGAVNTVDESKLTPDKETFIVINTIDYTFRVVDSDCNIEKNKKRCLEKVPIVSQYISQMITKFAETNNINGFEFKATAVEEDANIVNVFNSDGVRVDCEIMLPCEYPCCSMPTVEYFSTFKLCVHCIATSVTSI